VGALAARAEPVVPGASVITVAKSTSGFIMTLNSTSLRWRESKVHQRVWNVRNITAQPDLLHGDETSLNESGRKKPAHHITCMSPHAGSDGKATTPSDNGQSSQLASKHLQNL
jgi:hypothetical protein